MAEHISRDVQRRVLWTPGPATTTASVKAALLTSDLCPREAEFEAILAAVRERLLRVVNAPTGYESVLFSASGTGVMEAAVASLADDDRLLIIDNGAYGRRFKEIADIHHKTWASLDFAWGDPIDLAYVERALADGRFTVLIFVHHETTVGILNPLPDLVALARRFGVLSIVDAISSFGGVPIDIDQTPADLLLSSANKCLQGMPGISFVIASAAMLAKLAATPSRSYYLDITRERDYQREHRQFRFTPPVQVLSAFEQALAELFEEGVSDRCRRFERLHREVVRRMGQLGFVPLVDARHRGPLLTAFLVPEYPRFDCRAYRERLAARGISIYPGKGAKRATFRVGNIGDLRDEDVDQLIESTRFYLEQIGLNGIECTPSGLG